MAAGEDAWAELMAVSLGMFGTSIRAGEMMNASGSVVGARMTIMGDAARRLADGDYEEIGGMVQEMVVAFTEVGQSLFGYLGSDGNRTDSSFFDAAHHLTLAP